MKSKLYKYVFLYFIIAFSLISCRNEKEIDNKNYFNIDTIQLGNLRVSKSEIYNIANKIYFNECGGKKDLLVFWNKKEDFPSLGIGHFIWFPKGFYRAYGDVFPKLLRYYEYRGVDIPSWIRRNKYVCPWKNRDEFLMDRNRRLELENFLYSTMDIQAEFIILRFQNALYKIFNEPMPYAVRKHVIRQFYRVLYTKGGLYCLVDYVNFKGTGTGNTGNWGLLQVLEQMRGDGTGLKALQDFVRAARYVLKARVVNSKERLKEEKFLPGWYNRLNTYIQ